MNNETREAQDRQGNSLSNAGARTWIIWLAVLGGIILLMVFKVLV